MRLPRRRYLGIPAYVLIVIPTALVVIVAAAIGGWWFFIRDDASLATTALDPRAFASSTPSPSAAASGASTSRASATASASATGPAAVAPGTTRYTVDSAQSTASYFAGEKLASLPVPSTAQGTTRPVTGAFYLTPTGLDTTQKSSFTVDLRNLKSDQGMRDRRVQDTLQTSRFPTTTFTVTRIDGFPATLSETEDSTMTMTGTLDLHGVQKEVTWEVKAKKSGDVITGLATLKDIRYDAFGMSPPSIGGFVSVQDTLTLQVNIVARAQ